MKEHNLLAKKYNRRTGKYDSSKGPQNRKAKNRLHQKFITDRPLTQYVIQGLREVFKARPKLQYRMTVHSYQGIQYQSNAYRHELRKHNIFQSMSRRATCHDNAAMESFFPYYESRNRLLHTSL